MEPAGKVQRYRTKRSLRIDMARFKNFRRGADATQLLVDKKKLHPNALTQSNLHSME